MAPVTLFASPTLCRRRLTPTAASSLSPIPYRLLNHTWALIYRPVADRSESTGNRTSKANWKRSVEYLEFTAADPALDLAIDEALMLRAESLQDQAGILRIWEPAQIVVVVGRGSKTHEEVQVDRCQAAGIPVLRRCSGGASVVGAPGCLMYSVVLSYDKLPHLRRLDQAHLYVMSRIEAAVRAIGVDATLQGTCDLTVDNCKVSGNALRCRRHHLLYHGTLLYDMDLALLENLLRMPPRQPDYRQGRTHGRFVANLNVQRDDLVRSLQTVWQTESDSCKPSWRELNELEPEWMQEAQRLADLQYRQDSWNFRL